MFIAVRQAKCSRLRRSRAGHDVFSHRQTTSSSSRWSALPHASHVVGITHGVRVGRPQAEHGRDDSRDDVAGLLDDDGVAFAQVLAGDVLGVVQRRHRDRRAGDEDRLEHGVGRVRARASDVHLDPQQPRVLLLRRELERGRPARKLGGGAEPLAQREVVDLDDDAVGVELELLPLRAHSRQNATTSSMPVARGRMRLDGQSPGRQRRQQRRRARPGRRRSGPTY